MSTGFRVFLLLVLAAASVWVYRWRSDELERFFLFPQGYSATQEFANPASSSASMRIAPPRFDASRREASVAELVETFGPPPNWDREGTFQLDPERIAGRLAEGGEGEAIPNSERAPWDAFEDDPDLSLQPFEEEPIDLEPLPSEEEIIYTVRDGERLWTIAERLLGHGSRFPQILALNPGVIDDPKTVVPGTKLRIRVPLEKKTRDEVQPEPDPSDRAVEGGSQPSLVESPRTHRVGSHETLIGIARRYYPGDADGVRRLFEANRDQLSSPDLVPRGAVLVIPPR